MRVISGQWKGRRLKSPTGDDVRPTTDRVKEALFNILGSEVRDCLFLDLCCGAGGLGIEALSRGAAEVVFVDVSRRSLALVKENLAVCGADKDRVQLICADATRGLEDWIPGSESRKWILVADPPYRSEAAGAIMRELERFTGDTGFTAAAVEHGAHSPGLPTEAADRISWSTRRYGESYLAVARPDQPGRPEGD